MRGGEMKVGDIISGLHPNGKIYKLLIVSMKDDSPDFVIPIEPLEKHFVSVNEFSAVGSKVFCLSFKKDRLIERKQQITQDIDRAIIEIEKMIKEIEVEK